MWGRPEFKHTSEVHSHGPLQAPLVVHGDGHAGQVNP